MVYKYENNILKEKKIEKISERKIVSKSYPNNITYLFYLNLLFILYYPFLSLNLYLI